MMEKVGVVEEMKVRRMVMVEKMKRMERTVVMMKMFVIAVDFCWYSLWTRNSPYIDGLTSTHVAHFRVAVT